MDLLTRDEFREAVFARDGHKCVICEYTPSIMGVAGRPGLDAHHIIERRLWPDGGYYLDKYGDSVMVSDLDPAMQKDAEALVTFQAQQVTETVLHGPGRLRRLALELQEVKRA